MSLKCLKQLFFSLSLPPSLFCDTICSPAEGIEIPDAQVISRALVSLHAINTKLSPRAEKQLTVCMIGPSRKH